jgi:hypothetical protein
MQHIHMHIVTEEIENEDEEEKLQLGTSLKSQTPNCLKQDSMKSSCLVPGDNHTQRSS